MEYRILGPLEVRDGGRSIALGTAKQQALLAVLVLHANEFVPRERLIDELWGESPPPTAAKAVQVYVSHLRKLLATNGEETITTHPRGYVLPLDGTGVDADSFVRLAAQARERASAGDAEQAASLFREALSLWRGPALAGLSFEAGARNEVERLEEERLAALMDRIDCDLSLGRHEQLVGELEGLVARHPLRERLRGQLMLALYRSGRQADALRVYREGREALVEELGLEPSEPLQRLERAILVHDPALEAPAGLTRPPPPAPSEKAAVTADRRRPSRRVVAAAAAALVLAAIAGALALLLRSDEPVPTLLEPNSVGFIDAGSGRVTKSFPVGREPSSLTVADTSVWVANYRERTVTRLDRAGGQSVIPVAGHPVALTAHEAKVWVWTIEGRLQSIDPRFNSAGNPLPLSPQIVGLTGPSGGVLGDGPRRGEGGGRITSGGGFLWITVPLQTVIRVSPVESRRAAVISPDDGARAPIVFRTGEVWIAGYDEVFPIDASTGGFGAGARVGHARDLAFGAGSLWVVTGPDVNQMIVPALRRVDLDGRVVEATIDIGDDPVAVAWAGGSIWVASRSDRAIKRVDPAKNAVVQTIPLGAPPKALVADGDGVWVAVE